MASVYSCNIVVVGYGVHALLHAYDTGASIILTKEVKPHPFEFCDDKVYSQYGFRGTRVCDLYDFLLFNLSMAGRAPLAGRITSVKESVANRFLVEAERGEGLEVAAERIYYFEPQLSKTKKIVLDWIDVRRGQKHPVDRIESASDFVKWIHFYPTERICGSETSGLKDAAALSIFTNEQLLDNNFSEFLVRKKVKYLMETEGIRGPKNGKDPNDPTKQKYYSIKLESRKREVYPLVISIPEPPTTCFTSQGAYPLPVSRWILDSSGTTV